MNTKDNFEKKGVLVKHRGLLNSEFGFNSEINKQSLGRKLFLNKILTPTQAL